MSEEKDIRNDPIFREVAIHLNLNKPSLLFYVANWDPKNTPYRRGYTTYRTPK